MSGESHYGPSKPYDGHAYSGTGTGGGGVSPNPSRSAPAIFPRVYATKAGGTVTIVDSVPGSQAVRFVDSVGGFWTATGTLGVLEPE